jgi:hypothetical protein
MVHASLPLTNEGSYYFKEISVRMDKLSTGLPNVLGLCVTLLSAIRLNVIASLFEM